jgi:hypothetical protein
MGVHAHDFSTRPILPNCTTTFEQELSDEEKAEISLCNLSETVHASWTRQLGKQGDNIF